MLADSAERAGTIVNTSSVNSKHPIPSTQFQAPNSKHPMPTLLACSATKAAIADVTIGLGQSLAEKEIRINAVRPGPIWTPFIPSGMFPEQVKDFGSQTPFKRPGQPAELASAYVMLASDESSYTSGALGHGGRWHADLLRARVAHPLSSLGGEHDWTCATTRR